MSLGLLTGRKAHLVSTLERLVSGGRMARDGGHAKERRRRRRTQTTIISANYIYYGDCTLCTISIRNIISANYRRRRRLRSVA